MNATDAPAMDNAQDRSIVLALGAGGARGLAQIGVIEVLQERGMQIRAIAGTSCGALVGGACAAGKLPELMHWMQTTSRAEMLRLLDPGFGRPAMFTGERLVRTLRKVVGEPRIEELPIDFTAVAVDLMHQREVWLRRGDLWDAIRASFAIPGIFTPMVIGDMELVDGGLLAPLPITATRLAGPHRVIAVDIHSRPPQLAADPVRELVAENAKESPGILGRWVERHFSDDEAKPPQHHFKLMEVMSRALDTMQERIGRVQLALEPPDLLIRIPRDACEFYEFWRASELIEIGRREAEKALDAAGF
ncbi:patatin-like phospholipase family protein [Thermomonas sp.]|uniref:patatin-like phospholipase family protein n=1 Tax=Thermomonas sp. TaxID=1971895 RepID=UPI001D5E4398|nr:patatin-like phospholipase family protein [Thermomonas sp.]MBZ0087159.1 patatin-like phospholipase family protein [Thermomonas sp.]HRO62721.1 patatin-like phospholipase family protein [Thermomonas sp.]